MNVYAPDTKVTIIDMETVRLFSDISLHDFYAYHAKGIHEDETGRMAFSEHPYKIIDHYGWTDLLWISKVPVTTKWNTIYGADGKYISITNDTIVPVYDPTNIKVGFHGIRQYGFTRKNPSEFDDNSYIRQRFVRDGSEFSLIGYGVALCGNDAADGYELGTSSHFFTGNDFHMISDRPEKDHPLEEVLYR